MSTLDWWRTGTIYQVYIRSFADGNGDGTGDINGLRSKLPYLADLGIDGIWINPWYPSPLLDGGYDVADYRDIHPSYGTLEDADAMIKEAHELGIRILVDLVPNHCSWDHVWFKAALQAAPGSPERARFHFTEGSVADDGTVGPPNNWKSVFGGSAWTQVDDGQWYLHLFDPSQPDLDWTHPEVREGFRSILRFWLDRGADGFRVDVAHGLAKDMDFPDLSDHVQILSNAPKQPNHWDRDELHEIVREWRAVLDEYDGRMMVAEAWVSEESLPKYLRPDEYHQSFSFDLLMARGTPTPTARRSPASTNPPRRSVLPAPGCSPTTTSCGTQPASGCPPTKAGAPGQSPAQPMRSTPNSASVERRSQH